MMFVVCAVLSFVCCSYSHAQTPMEVIVSGKTKTPKISDQISKEIVKWDSRFKIYDYNFFAPSVQSVFTEPDDGLPMAVIGDFNGDSRADLALMGVSEGTEKAIVVVNEGASRRIIELSSQPASDPQKSILSVGGKNEKGLSLYLSLFRSKEINFKKNKVFKKAPDAIQIEKYFGATKAYYLKPNKKSSYDVIEYKGLVQ